MQPSPSLDDLGWSPEIARALALAGDAGRPLFPARVAEARRGTCRVWAEAGELEAGLAGRLRHEARGPEDLPAVGDWVAIELRGEGRTTIHRVLPRRTRLVRKAAGRRDLPQVIAANLDTVFVVSALGGNFNPRRIERTVALVREGGAAAAILVNKADLGAEIGAGLDPQHLAQTLAEAARAAPGAPVLAVSARTGAGLDALSPFLGRGSTVALVGSSGVGKSSLINHLVGVDLQAVAEVRSSDGKGRHTTTARNLVLLPGGACLVDTPGMREMGLWDTEAGLAEAFPEVAALTGDCRFSDCSHEAEPGCAVQAALAAGGLEAERLASWNKLRREAAFATRRDDVQAMLAEKRRTKAVHRALRRRSESNGG